MRSNESLEQNAGLFSANEENDMKATAGTAKNHIGNTVASNKAFFPNYGFRVFLSKPIDALRTDLIPRHGTCNTDPEPMLSCEPDSAGAPETDRVFGCGGHRKRCARTGSELGNIKRVLGDRQQGLRSG
jgi:hypothetical protein